MVNIDTCGGDMRATGVVRKLDDLGRLVFPIELRRTLNINEGDPMEIFVDEGSILLKKYQPECIFCGEAKDVSNYKGKNICADCREELKK